MSDRRERLVVRVDPDLKGHIPTYFANRRRDVQTVLEALADEDYPPIRVVGHRMKGSGAGYGFDGLTEIGAALETAANARDAGAVRACVEALTSYLDRVEVI